MNPKRRRDFKSMTDEAVRSYVETMRGFAAAARDKDRRLFGRRIAGALFELENRETARRIVKEASR